MPTRIQVRRGSTAQWATANPVLASGEIGVDKTLGKFKVGDGVAVWTSLPFAAVLPAELTAAVSTAISNLVAGAPGALDTLDELAAALADDASFAATMTTALAGKQATSAKGQANGYAGLDSGGTVPDAQLPGGLARDSEVTSAVGVETARALAAEALAIPLTQRAAANGVATLDAGSKIPDVQIPDAITRDSELAAALAALVNSAPGTLDTLAELATALGNDPNLATTLTAAIAAKVSDTAYNASSWDGVTSVAPSKNAVRDKIEALSGATVPAQRQITLVGVAAKANTRWDTLTGDVCTFGSHIDSDGNIDAERTWEATVEAGTYTLYLFHKTDTNRGIYTITIDALAPSTYGGSADTVDGNAASGHVRTLITGLVLTSGVKAIKLKMATKSGATFYYGAVAGMILVRTA